MQVDRDYQPATSTTASSLDEWADPAIGAYLEQSQQADLDRIDTALAQIDAQLAARETLHDDIIAELDWQLKKYEQERDRLAKPGLSRTAECDHVYARLQECRQARRDERRAHWRDRQRLVRERRKLLQERAAIRDENLSEIL
ncbi:hypothetical protein [Halorussus salinisoli]|uniref:hypothetical protein n=1 Tax=Halorussus salinisoli TaxID=2558242 RepID=UPI0010C1B48E|nr:hypothetical protein [Halorussus salinisoli]